MAKIREIVNLKQPHFTFVRCFVMLETSLCFGLFSDKTLLYFIVTGTFLYFFMKKRREGSVDKTEGDKPIRENPIKTFVQDLKNRIWNALPKYTDVVFD